MESNNFKKLDLKLVYIDENYEVQKIDESFLARLALVMIENNAETLEQLAEKLVSKIDLMGFDKSEVEVILRYEKYFDVPFFFQIKLPNTHSSYVDIISKKWVEELTKEEYIKYKQLLQYLREKQESEFEQLQKKAEAIKKEVELERMKKDYEYLKQRNEKLTDENYKLKRIIKKLLTEDELEELENEAKEREEQEKRELTVEEIEFIKKIVC